MSAQSPGKIILSGEHAVVYGCPALVAAVDCYAFAELTVLPEPRLQMQLGDRPPQSLALDDLPPLLEGIRARHQQFLDGRLPIESVLRTPEELYLGCAAALRELDATRWEGFQVAIRSDIPLGSGMGSSAATILAAVRVMIEHHPGLSLTHERSIALHAEHWQHGRSSGLDVIASHAGGMMRFNGPGDIRAVTPGLDHMHLVNTGRPLSTTGACVTAVREGYAGDATLWRAFAACTDRMVQGAEEDRMEDWIEPLRENHRLLVQIGVVPEVVQTFITGIEEQGGAAKICGAGSIKGDAAGMVMVYGGGQAVETYMKNSAYPTIQLRVATHGTQTDHG